MTKKRRRFSSEFKFRAALTRARMALEGSPPSSEAGFSIGTRGTSRWLSMRSMIGPDSRF